LKDYAKAVVSRRQGRLEDVARELGVSRKTLWSWRKSWDELLIDPRPAG
jgi:transposase-like protein